MSLSSDVSADARAGSREGRNSGLSESGRSPFKDGAGVVYRHLDLSL